MAKIKLFLFLSVRLKTNTKPQAKYQQQMNQKEKRRAFQSHLPQSSVDISQTHAAADCPAWVHSVENCIDLIHLYWTGWICGRAGRAEFDPAASSLNKILLRLWQNPSLGELLIPTEQTGCYAPILQASHQRSNKGGEEGCLLSLRSICPSILQPQEGDGQDSDSRSYKTFTWKNSSGRLTARELE